MGTAAHDFDRYCLTCRHSLRGLESHQCPECGRAFDPSDPRTTSPYPYSRFWAVSAITAKVVTAIASWFVVVLFLISAIGWLGDMGVGALLMLVSPVILPILVIAFFVAMLARVALRPFARVRGLAALPLVVSIVLTNWPFRLNVMLHKGRLEDIATRARNGETFEGWQPVGLLPITNVRVIEWGNVGFRLSPWSGRGDGVILVRKQPDAPRTWYNTNWESNLGDGWFLVFED